MHKLYENDLGFVREFGKIAGIDEAGRGALAGPVVIAAAVLGYDETPLDLMDSKQLSAPKREALYELICAQAIAYQIVEISAKKIDEINIRQASILGFQRAFEALGAQADFALIDGRDLPEDLIGKGCAIIKGDTLHASIAAASILAKVHRDRLMIALDAVYPEYGFARHKGYGTALHYKALRAFGPCGEHRRSFRLL